MIILFCGDENHFFGDYDAVMQALNDCIKWSFATYGKVVFVVKFLHGDLRPEG